MEDEGFSSGGLVAEGFVCPLCIRELASFAALQEHVSVCEQRQQAAAATASKDRRRSVFGSVKQAVSRRLARDDLAEPEPYPPAATAAAAAGVQFPPQTLGVTRSHKTAFKEKRRMRKENDDINENRLLSRLEKLLFKGPSAPSSSKARKEFERSVVAWNEDKLVPICPECGRKFSVSRRRHHCRLCGGVICNDCSLALDVFAAVVFILPPKLANSTSKSPATDEELDRLRSQITYPEDTFRMCGFCNSMLIRSQQRRKRMGRQAAALDGQQPPVVQLYQIIHDAMENIRAKLDAYNDLVDTINTRADLSLYGEAADRRVELMKWFNDIDVASKKVLALVKDAEKNPSSAMQNRNINSVAREFLSRYMVGMEALPPESVIIDRAKKAKMEALEKDRKERERRDRELRMRQEAERAKYEAELRGTNGRAEDRGDSTSSSANSPTGSAGVVDMIERERRSLQAQLKDAKEAGDKDVVAALQTQLKELQVFRSEVKKNKNK